MKNYYIHVIILFIKKILSNRYFYKFYKFLNKTSFILMGGGASSDRAFLRKIKKILPQDSILFDVGAGTGEFIKFFEDTNYNLNFYAFEPTCTYIKILQNKKNYKNFVKVFNIGLSENEGVSKIFFSKIHRENAHSSMYKNVIIDIHGQQADEISIKISTLDKFVNENNIEEINFLKIDVEGNELKVLLGAKKLLQQKKIDIIQLEFNTMNIFSKFLVSDLFLFKDYLIFRMLHSGQLILIEEKDYISNNVFMRQELIMIRNDYSSKKLNYLISD
jgi:FkbM family methyltransferase